MQQRYLSLHAIARMIAAILLSFSASAGNRAQAADRRPNILFCLADDWAWPHAGVYGDKVVHTPTFDRVAREGVLFNRAFSAAPSCTASRAAMLTGQAPHRLAEGANLWGFLPKRFPVYPDLLEEAGYYVGYTRKGWAPGSVEASGRTRNPAGPRFKDFATFFQSAPKDKPFCFWFGSTDPHRPYVPGTGLKAGLDPSKVVVPPYWPDTPEVRSDILDYYFAVERYDRESGQLIKMIEDAGQLENTIVVMTGDNGWPFPRCKANLLDGGTQQALGVRWPARVKGGRSLDDFISLTDLAPTFLEAAGLKPLPEMTGRSLLGLLTGAEKPGQRDLVFFERERHANVRKGDLGFPVRAVRNPDFLYLRNLRPDRWPAGEPEKYISVGPFGDCDPSPTKDAIINHKDDPKVAEFFRLCFDKRPADELYDLKKDPYQLNNVASQPEYQAALKKMRDHLDRWMTETDDPRAAHDDDRFDSYQYFGDGAKMPAAKKTAPPK